jgi:SAM-dependent methyltransferase
MMPDLPFHKADLLTRKQSRPYQALAPIYNHIMRHVDYSSWANYLDAIIRKIYIETNQILDIGCGSGQLIREMVKLGYRIQGCDPSPNMLKIAKRNNPGIKFWTDSLPELNHTNSADYPLITCLYDTMNYLQDLGEIQKSLHRISQLLRPGGYLIFDVVSEQFCKLYFDKADEEEIIDNDYAYVRHSYYMQKTSQQINKFLIYSPSGIFEEIHTQRIYPFQLLKRLIDQKSPFVVQAIYDDFSFHPAGNNSGRAHFILKRASND